MSDKPNTISDKEWQRLQRAAADKTGGPIKTPDQAAAARTWTTQRGKAGAN